jgi:hypothetical protein
MKKYYGYFGLALIMVFSFYYTEQISTLVLNKNPLMMTIKEQADNYNVKSVNAEIVGENIIPGINGLYVNSRESFYAMQSEDIFNEYYLVFEQKKPDVTLEDNKDKLIISGNPNIRQVTLILETENEVSEYLKLNEFKASLLVDMNTYKDKNYFESLNNETIGFKSLENNLTLNKENKHICVVNTENKDICQKHKNYLVSPSLRLNNSNLLDVKKNLKNGSIIVIGDTAGLSDVKLLLKEIKYKDLELVYLSELISEVNKK